MEPGHRAVLVHHRLSISEISLTGHLSTEHALEVYGAIVKPESDLLNGRVGDWPLSAEALDEIDVVYMEGGWTDGSGSATERFPLELAESFVYGGGQLNRRRRGPRRCSRAHTMSHSAAVAWLESGVHIKAAADLLGHSSIAITGDLYGHTSDDTARAAVDGVGAALGFESTFIPHLCGQLYSRG